METRFKGRHFITEDNWTKEELDIVFDTAFDLKKKFYAEEPTLWLPYKTLFMMFFEQSTRTRNSDRKSTRLNSSHSDRSRMPSSA